MSAVPLTLEYDLKNVVGGSRLSGLWKMLTGYRLKYLAATICQGLSALAKTFTFLLLRYFVDTYFAGQAGVGLPLIALGFIGLAFMEGGFTFLTGRLAAQTAEGVTRRLRNYLFDHIQHLTFAYHDKTQTGELIQRSTSDVDALRRFFADQAIGIGRIILLFTINLITVLELNSTLAAVSVIIIPLVFVISIFFFRRVSKLYEANQEQEATLSTTLQENLSGVRVVKAFARQQYEMDKFEKDNWEKFVRGKKLTIMHALFWPISDTLCAAQIILGFFVGAMLAITGEITIGTYLAYAGLIVYLIFPIRNLGRLIVDMSTGMVSLGRVLEIIRQEREPLDEGDYTPTAAVKGDLNFDQVGFAYDHSTTPVLEDITFHCAPGQAIALLGSTGSGKTTLVNLLPRFYDYTQGRILLDGVELKRYTRRYLRQQIGIVEQEPFLFSRSIRENITYGVGREVTQAEIEAAAQAAAVHEVICTFPNGYDTQLGEKGVTLSGGQKQRVAIARTLLKNPRILILDDSTSSVDTETEAGIRSALTDLMKDRTTFIIAHRVQSIMNADLILVLDQGKIVQRGRHADLLAQAGTYREIYNIQTQIEDELEKEIASVA